MRHLLAAAGLMLLSTVAFAQDNTAPAGARGAPAARGAAAPSAANAIKPGSMERPHGLNGMGGDYPVPGLYRSNPGNGLYGAYVGDYGGQR